MKYYLSENKDLIPNFLANVPFCNVCNKQVENVSMHSSFGGKRTCSIECHGEKFSMDWNYFLNCWVKSETHYFFSSKN